MAKALLLDSSWSTEWNRFVSEADDSSPYHRFEWMEAVEAAYGHKAYPLAVEEKGAILAVLPLLLMVHPLNNPLIQRASLVSLPFCDLSGMIGIEQHQQLLRDTASDLAKRMNVQLLEIRHREREGLGFDFDRLSEDLDGQKVSMLLELEPSSEKQLAAFKPKLRSQIKKAIKNGCTTVVGNTPQLVEDFYYVFSRNMRSLGSPVHSKALFHAICKAYGDKAILAVVYFEGEVAAGGIVLSNGHQAAIPWASSLADYNRLAPNMLLYWELLSHCADAGIRVFDFGRSSFGEGTFRFKKQWGAQPYRLTWENWLDQNGSPAKPPGRLRSIIERVWRRLPLSVANFFGPLVRKHIRL